MNRPIYYNFNYFNLSGSPLLVTDYSSLEMEENDCYVGIFSHGLEGRNGSFSQTQAGLMTLDGGSLSQKLFFVQEMYWS